MKKLYLAVVVVSLGVVGLSIGVSGLVVKNRLLLAGEPVDHYVPLTEMGKGSFRPLSDGVNIVVVPMKNPGLSDNGSYEFQLIEEGEGLRDMTFVGYNVGDPADVKFQFEPVVGVVGKNLVAKIEVKGEGGSSLLAGVDKKGEMVLGVYRRVGGKMEGLKLAINNFLGRLLADKIFLVYWLGILGIVGGSLAYASKK